MNPDHQEQIRRSQRLLVVAWICLLSPALFAGLAWFVAMFLRTVAAFL